MAPSILVDSTDPLITYFGKQWQSGFDPETYGGSCNTCRTDTFTNLTVDDPPKISFSFYGTSIDFFGQPTDNFRLNYTFDGSRALVGDTNITTGVAGKTGIRLWGVDRLTATSHTVSLIPTDGQPIFDYLVFTPTTSTTLNGKTLVLDDTDPLIKYGGSWTPQPGTRFAGGIAFQDTRRGATKVGDTLTIGFVGASISVYGMLNQQPGKLSSTYSIDGGNPVTVTSYNGTQRTARDVWNLQHRFFYKEVIPGNHTLTVTLSEVTEDQVFWIDYLTYEGVYATTLRPPTTAKSSNSKSLEKLIGGIVAGAIVSLIIFSMLRARYGKRLKQWWTQEPYYNSAYAPERGSPHIYEVPTRPPPLRMPEHLTSPGFRHGGPGVFVRDPVVPQLHQEIDSLRRENERMQRERSLPTTPAHEPPILPISSPAHVAIPMPAPVPVLERPRPIPLGVDAGPAEPPPPYNDSHYIP